MNNSRSYIPGWLIFVGFMIGFWPGLILLIIRILQGASSDNAARRAQERRERDVRRTYQPPESSTVHTVDYRRAQESSPRVYQSPRGADQQSASQPQGSAPQPQRAAQPQRTTQPQSAPQPSLTRRQRELVSGRGGKGLWIAGCITLGAGVFSALMALMAGMAEGNFLFETLMVSGITAAAVGIPGTVLAITGNKHRNRAARCRNYLALMGSRKKVSIDEMAASIPTGYDQARRDLQWMLDEGFFPGFYIDGTNRCLIHPDAHSEPAPERPEAAPEQPCAGGTKVYPEEKRIRAINDRIDDEYISERMYRLEELTHNILACAEAHPEKEHELRQFRGHYLPTSLKILESYARFEQQGVDGENISSAMKDVKSIMDKLVSGFEKQLDVLYAAEALDVSTDISVLENMMTMEGLGPLSPFDVRNTSGSKEETK